MRSAQAESRSARSDYLQRRPTRTRRAPTHAQRGPRNVCKEGFSRFAARIACFPKVSFEVDQQIPIGPKATTLPSGIIFSACGDAREKTLEARQNRGKDSENSHFGTQSADFLPRSQRPHAETPLPSSQPGAVRRDTLFSQSRRTVRHKSVKPHRAPTAREETAVLPRFELPKKRRRTPMRLFTASSQSKASASTTEGFAPFRVTNRCQGRLPSRRGRARRIWFTNLKDGSGNSEDRDSCSKDESGNSLAKDRNPQGRKRRPDKTGTETRT